MTSVIAVKPLAIRPFSLMPSAGARTADADGHSWRRASGERMPEGKTPTLALEICAPQRRQAHLRSGPTIEPLVIGPHF